MRSAFAPLFALLVAATPSGIAAAAARRSNGAVLTCPQGSTRHNEAGRYGPMAWCVAAGERQGPYVAWNWAGRVVLRGSYRNDREEGWWRSWNAKGELTSATEYHLGSVIARRRFGEDARHVRRAKPGDAVYPCPEGAVIGEEGPPDNRRQWCELRRSDGSYVRDGLWIMWFANGRKWKREDYRLGVPDGTWTTWWEDGHKRREWHYRSGAQEGLATEWDERGVKRAVSEWRHGKCIHVMQWDERGMPNMAWTNDAQGRTASRTSYYPNGRRQTQQGWTAGEWKGLQREWWPNGRLRSEGEIRRGQKLGTWRYWSAQGRLMRIEVYDRDAGHEDESFSTYPDDAPSWAPRPVPRPDTAAPTAPLRCPNGGTKITEKETIGVGDLLSPSDDSNDVRMRLLISALNLVRMTTLRRQACVAGFLFWRHKQGPAREWIPDGSHGTGAYRNDLKEGVWIYWGPNGKPIRRQPYRQGKLDGEAVTWHPNGNTATVKNYANGVEQGPFAEWYSDGARHRVGRMRGSKLDGLVIDYRENGLRSEQREYRDGVENGTRIEWWQDGSLRRVQMIRNGVAQGPYVAFGFASGIREEGSYADGKKEGHWIEWKDRRKKSDGYYARGVRNGEWVFYRDDGGAVQAFGRYERGRKVGLWTTFYFNGNPREQGRYVWCKSPPKYVETHFANGGHRWAYEGAGCRSGRWTYWREDGTVEGTFVHDPAARPASPPPIRTVY